MQHDLIPCMFHQSGIRWGSWLRNIACRYRNGPSDETAKPKTHVTASVAR